MAFVHNAAALNCTERLGGLGLPQQLVSLIALRRRATLLRPVGVIPRRVWPLPVTSVPLLEVLLAARWALRWSRCSLSTLSGASERREIDMCEFRNKCPELPYVPQHGSDE